MLTGPVRSEGRRIGPSLREWASVLADARLYLVTPALERSRLQALLDGGVDIVQLRMKEAGDDAVVREATWMREACAAAGVPFIVNDRPDLARAVEADGVHVGQDDRPPAEARDALGANAIVGLSTHEAAQLAAAPAEADYVAVGPVWATPTKPGRTAAGLLYVRHAAGVALAAEEAAANAAADAAASVPAVRPWFAIGGIDETNIHAVVEAGARRVAAVRALVMAKDPAQAAATLKAALTEAPLGRA